MFLYSPSSEDSDDEEAEEDMNVDESKKNEDDEVAIALAAADALGKATQVSSAGTDDIIDGLKELDMDNYDEEEEGKLNALTHILIWVEHSFFYNSNVLAVFLYSTLFDKINTFFIDFSKPSLYQFLFEKLFLTFLSFCMMFLRCQELSFLVQDSKTCTTQVMTWTHISRIRLYYDQFVVSSCFIRSSITNSENCSCRTMTLKKMMTW